MKWSKVMFPKEIGGLGIKDLSLYNKSVLMKWHWTLEVQSRGFCLTERNHCSKIWEAQPRYDDYYTKFWIDKCIWDSTLKEAFTNIFIVIGSPESFVARNKENA